MAELGEFELIERFFDRPARDAGVVVGVGDDAAVLRVAPGHELVLAVDMMVEGRHFLAGTDPERLGHKILAVNLSDMAAMGARPRWALLAGALPDSDPDWLGAFSRGLFALAESHGVDLVGGDTTRGPRNLCLTIAGEVPVGQAIRRAGARPGDDVWVSGELGGAMLALAAIQGRTTLGPDDLVPLVRRLERPEPRVALGIALRGTASAMLDVSDGLTGDLAPHSRRVGRRGARRPRHAFPVHRCSPHGATDPSASSRWRACSPAATTTSCCSPPAMPRASASRRSGSEVGVPLTRIGTMTPPETGLVVRAESGDALPVLPRAFDHFAAPIAAQGGRA